MLNLPKQLFRGFELLKKSRLVKSHHTDGDSIQHFQQILNNAQPTSDEQRIMYNIVHGMYLENKNKFINFIKGTKMECLSLWCDARSIVRVFNLRQSVYIKKNESGGLYNVSIYRTRQATESTTSIVKHAPESDHPMINFLMSTFDDPGAADSMGVDDENKSDTSSEPQSEDDGKNTLTETLAPMTLLSRSISNIPWGDINSDDE